MILFGQQIVKVNQKGEVTLPSNVCAGLQNHAYLLQGFDHDLLLMTVDAFERYYSSIKNTSLSDPLARKLTRLFLSNAVEIKLDDSGLVQLPNNLQQFAGVKDEVVLVGQGDYYEMWAPASWEEQQADLDNAQANIDRFVKFDLTLA